MSKQQAFSKTLQEAGLQGQRELAFISSVYARETALQVNILNFQNALKTRLFEDALRNYPLNIPPLVMLHNSGLSTSSVIGDLIDDDSLANDLIAATKRENGNITIDDYQQVLRNRPVALSVFITPLQMDSRVGFKDKVYTIVWDKIYQNLESIFISEYNRGGERPVIFYPSAWNLNSKPGLHASEILYFFTKGMPVIVLEPRYDGKNLKFLFSCWGIGELPDRHVRQELNFNIGWDEIVLPIMYERSKRTFEKLSKIENLSPSLLSTLKKVEQNIRMYEQLKESEMLSDGDYLDDLYKYFNISDSDYSMLANMISEALGISISLISDIHHLTSRGIPPKFPEMINKYFQSTFKNLSKPDKEDLMNSIKGMMKTAYTELLLGDTIIDSEFETFESSISNELGFSNDRIGLKERLSEESKVFLHADTVISEESCDAESDRNAPQDIFQMIEDKCKIYDIDASSIKERIKLITAKDTNFYKELSDACASQAMIIEDIIGNE